MSTYIHGLLCPSGHPDARSSGLLPVNGYVAMTIARCSTGRHGRPGRPCHRATTNTCRSRTTT
eukprot:7530200-Pyramimonas_sp.AAC.1